VTNRSLAGPPSLVSVVLCCHNGSRTLEAQLAALARQDYAASWELIFVDDRSTDNSVAIAESWSDRLPIRTVPTRLTGQPVGLAQARNIGGRAAHGEVLLFCDDDDVADPGWISALAAAAEESAAFGGFDEEELLNELPHMRAWREPLTPGQLPHRFDKLPSPIGNNSGVLTSVFLDIGGFEAEYSEFGSGEEVDFFWRVQLAGYELRYVPNAIMHVRHRSGLRPLARQWYGYGRSSIVLHRRFRHDLGLRRTSRRKTMHVLIGVVRGIPGAIVNERKRGIWVRTTSYSRGQVVGSLVNRVWHLD
jgi:glycosyltransferase involved in cell wall biosynthesis